MQNGNVLIEFCGIAIGIAEKCQLLSDCILAYYAKEIHLYPKYDKKLNYQNFDVVFINIYTGEIGFMKNYEVKHTEKFMTFCS